MGVYIAEAQRAKRILQHSMQSRAMRTNAFSDDQYDALHVPEFSEQPQSNLTGCDAAEFKEPMQAKQAHHSSSQPESESVAVSCSPPAQDATQTMSQAEDRAHRHASSSAHASQLSQHLLPAGRLAQTEQQTAAQAALQSTALAAAEPSFALQSMSQASRCQQADVQLHELRDVKNHGFWLQSYAQTDAQPEDVLTSHVEQRVSHVIESCQEKGHEEEDECITVQQSGSKGTGSESGQWGAAAEYSVHSRQQASPNAAKFAFAR